MKKIAMLNCLNANEICTGAACMKAYNSRTKSFSRYQEQDVEVAAFMRCNGCSKDPKTDSDLQEKIQRLLQENVQTVHAGVCTKDRQGQECPVITQILEMLSKTGIEIVRGTH